MEATSQPRLPRNYLTTPEISLHSTRKQPAKPWKRSVTALPQRMHPRVYRVEPVNFKELVQRLTGAQDLEPEVHQVEAKPLMISHNTITAKANPFAFDLSPSSSRFWEAFPLLSPSSLSRW